MWNNCPNNFASVLQNPTIPLAGPATQGTYNVQVMDANGCIDWASVTIDITEELRGLNFDGANDRCLIPNSPAYNFGVDPFSIEALIECDPSLTTGYHIIMSNRNGSPKEGILFGVWNGTLPAGAQGKLFVQFGGTSPNYIDLLGIRVNDGRCYHVSLTRASTGVVKFFVNGIESTTQVTASTNVNSSKPLYIGYDDVSRISMNGNVGYLRLWNIERSRTDLYDYQKYYIFPHTNDLVGYWPIDPDDEHTGIGQEIFDRSAVANNGVLGTTTGLDVTDPIWVDLCIRAYRPSIANSQTLERVNDSLDVNQLNSVIVYPNPSNGVFHFNYHIGKYDQAHLDISDMYGRRILQTILKSDEQAITVDLENTAPAIYYYRIFINDTIQNSGLIIVE